LSIVKHNSGHALKRYKRMVDYFAGNRLIKRYEPFFDNQWKKISYEYIDELTDFEYKGYWYYDVIERGKLFYFIKRVINKIMQHTFWRGQENRNINEMPREMTLCARPGQERFLECTRRYIDRLFLIPNNLMILRFLLLIVIREIYICLRNMFGEYILFRLKAQKCFASGMLIPERIELRKHITKKR